MFIFKINYKYKLRQHINIDLYNINRAYKYKLGYYYNDF